MPWLKQVVDFQAEQLKGIDVPLVAVRLRRGRLDEVRAVATERVKPVNRVAYRDAPARSDGIRAAGNTNGTRLGVLVPCTLTGGCA